MKNDPYEAGIISQRPTFERRGVRAQVVAVLYAQRHNRGLVLVHPRTRCLRRYDVHEMLLTNDPKAKPGRGTDVCAAIAFFEVDEGGVVGEGESVFIRNRCIGTVVGFDETHAPNHINVIVRDDVLRSGVGLGISLGDAVVFSGAGAPGREEGEADAAGSSGVVDRENT